MSEAIQAALKKATAALKKLEALYSKLPYPQELCTWLRYQEAMNSLLSQKIQIPIEEVYYYHRKKKARAPQKIQSVLDYYEALSFFSSKQSLTKALLEEIHGHVATKDTISGIRTQQNWIGPIGCPAEEAHYFPPPPEILPQKISHFLKKFNQNTHTPLLKLSLLFGEFLTIHPFMDGNGRVARVLAPLYLYWKGKTTFPYLYVSRYLAKHRKQYYEKLFYLSYKKKWDDWLVFFLKAIKSSALHLEKEISSTYRLALKIDSLLTPYIDQEPRESIIKSLFSCPFFLPKDLPVQNSVAHAAIQILKRHRFLKAVCIKGQQGMLFFRILKT